MFFKLRMNPSCVRSKAWTVSLGEQMQFAGNGAEATFTRVVHRPAAKGRETGAENHGAVEQVFIGNHAFAQTRHTSVEHGQNQTVDSVLWRKWWFILLLCFAVFPGIQPLAGFFAQMTIVYFLL